VRTDAVGADRNQARALGTARAVSYSQLA
jgi:hypothetical protein